MNDSDIGEQDIRQFQETICEHSDYDFSEYSANSLRRRLIRITEDYGSDVQRLIRTISSDPAALEEVVKRITVNTTELFRDPAIWQNIILRVLPRFRQHSSINIWHSGCSTGQEVYSMMIALDQFGLLERSNIYASDLNTDVLETAGRGQYRLRFNREYINNFNDVFSPGIAKITQREFNSHKKYLKIDETRDLIQIKDFLRNKPVFKKIDLVRDDNLFFLNFDIIVCRNVIIYFNYELQNRVLRLYHRSMRDNGCLILGLHESIIGPCSKLFSKQENYYVRLKKES